MTTGPHSIGYQIPDITLGDTFNEWREVTNAGIINKLNRMKVYTGVSGDGISVGMKDDGETVIEHSGHVTKGVTFSGNVTFNGAYTVINANEFSIDDYTIMLGATYAGSSASGGGSGSADSTIAAVGGGGLQILRNEGHTASFLWKPDAYGGTGSFGPTGTWYVEGPHLGLTKDAWFVSEDNTYRFHTNKKQAGNSGTGVLIGPGDGNNNHKLSIQSTAGNIYPVLELGTRGAVDGITNESFSRLVNGSITRTVSKTEHGFSFGAVVRYDGSLGPGSDGWTLGIANTEVGAEAVGILTKVSGNTFEVAYSGEVIGDFRDINEEIGADTKGKTLSPGSVYFLSTSAHGKITSIPPTTANHINKPVLVALDPIGPLTGATGDRALIVNYRGALVPDAASDITEQVQNRILITQTNDFVVGDLVRFDRDVNYGWSGDNAGVTHTNFYTNGVWLRGQANSREEAEVLGMVTTVNVAGDRDKFYITLNGKLDLSGVVATDLGIESGRVYFLSANSAPDGRGGLGLSGDSLTRTPPLTDGHVKKPFAVSVSPTELILLNYVGEVIGQGQGGGGGGGGDAVVASPLASIVAWSGTGDSAPEDWMLCDGSLISQSQYPELYGEIGHSYLFAGHDVDGNGVAVPDETEESLNALGQFRIPDLRNRFIIGQNVDNPDGSPPYGLTFDSSLGPLTHGITLGEQGGEMVHKLSSAESGLKSHSHNDNFSVSDTALGSHSHNVKTHTKTDYGWEEIAGSDFEGADNDFLGKNAQYGNVDGVVVSTDLGSHGHSISGSVSTNSGSAASNAHNILTPYIGLRYIIKVKEGEASGGPGITTVLDAGRNLFINGNFDFWQRVHSDEVSDTGNHQAGRSADGFQANSNEIGGAFRDRLSAAQYSSRRFFADRWGLLHYTEWNNDGTNGGASRHRFTLSKANDTLPVLQRTHAESKPATYYLRLTSTQTNESGTTGGVTGPGISQRIEGVDTVHNEKATISFWARRSAGTATTLDGAYVMLRGLACGTGDYRTSSSDGGAGLNYRMYDDLQSPTFKLNTSWTKYVYTFDVPNIAGVCAGNESGSPVDGVDVPPSSWQLLSGGGAIPGQGFIDVSIQPVPATYGAGGDSDKDLRWQGEFDIAQVQFERGSTETEFDSRDLTEEQRRCERYYQQSHGPFGCTGSKDTTTKTNYSPEVSCVSSSDRTVGPNLQMGHMYRTPMRHAPLVRIFSFGGVEGNINGPDESGGDWHNPANFDGRGNGEVMVLGDLAENGSRSTKNGFGTLQVQNNITPESQNMRGRWGFHFTAEAEF